MCKEHCTVGGITAYSPEEWGTPIYELYHARYMLWDTGEFLRLSFMRMSIFFASVGIQFPV